MELSEQVLIQPYAEITYKMHIILLVAETMMQNGADADRTVRYIRRTATYMGIPAENVHSHIMYTTVMLNICDAERTYTEFRKCKQHAVNMSVLSTMSRLIWRAIRDNYPLERFEKEVTRIRDRKKPYTGLQTAIGSSFACGGNCLLFGCDLAAFFITTFCAFLGYWTRRLCDGRHFNPYAAIAIAAFVATLVAFLSQRLGISATPMLPIAACALFMVPGVPLLNAASEVLNNFITAGMTRAIDTLLIVGGMAFGTAIAMRLGSMTNFTTLGLSPGDIYFYHPIAGAISAGGFSMLFNVPRRVSWVVAVGGMLTILLRNIAMFDLGFSQAAASFIGAATLGILALKAIHWFHVPNVVLTIPSAIPLIPGVLLYRFLFTLLNINAIDTEMFLHGVRDGVEALVIITGVAIGVAIPNIFFSRQIERTKIERAKRLLASRYIDEDEE